MILAIIVSLCSDSRLPEKYRCVVRIAFQKIIKIAKIIIMKTIPIIIIKKIPTITIIIIIIAEIGQSDDCGV